MPSSGRSDSTFFLVDEGEFLRERQTAHARPPRGGPFGRGADQSGVSACVDRLPLTVGFHSPWEKSGCVATAGELTPNAEPCAASRTPFRVSFGLAEAQGFSGKRPSPGSCRRASMTEGPGQQSISM